MGERGEHRERGRFGSAQRVLGAGEVWGRAASIGSGGGVVESGGMGRREQWEKERGGKVWGRGASMGRGRGVEEQVWGAGGVGEKSNYRSRQ